MNDSDPLEEVIFNAARVFTAPDKRRQYLDLACEGKPELRQRVERLLETSEEADAFFGRKASFAAQVSAPVLPLAPAAPTSAALAEQPGSRIGRYKLLEQIGEGGFGVVFMADQEEPIRRRVALKLIKLGMDTKQVVARFEAERQALAMMDHPNIAKVLDGGATETGRPFFVMELVHGVPITEFCDTNQLSTEERVRLFIPVCQAIQSAHQKGIIHRDLKPTNILVTLNSGTPLPKVIDFGVAKATDQRLTEKTLFTNYGMMIGTPAYMSPEQAEMSHLDVDTRADIYSLGALLYELLTGTLPFPENRLRSAGYQEMQRIILEEEPERPSTRLRRQLTTMATDAAAQSKIKNQKSKIGDDLDWIVMKCLEKDRARRYETANGLARDLERHLANEPVVARPPSRLYEFQKTVRRHWLGFTAVGGVLVALAIGMVVSTFEATRARVAERRGERLFYAGKMNMVQAAWEQNRVAQVRQLLDETANYPDRGFEWYYWQRQTHLELKTLGAHLDEFNAAVFSRDGQRIFTGDTDTAIKVWDATNGDLLSTLAGHLDRIYALATSPDGQRIASASRDATVKIWDVATGKELVNLDGHGGRVWSLNFSRDSRRILTTSEDGTAKIWDAANGEELLTFSGHSGRVQDAAFSPDGHRAVSGGDDGMVRVWDTSTGHSLLTLTNHSDGVCSVAYSPNGRLIASGGLQRDPTARVWDADSGKELVILRGHDDAINTVRFSSDSRRIVTASDDRTAKVWEAATGKELFTIKGHVNTVADAGFSPDGERIVTASTDQTVKIWDGTVSREAIPLKIEQGHPFAAAVFSPNGQRIVTGSTDQTARVWDAANGQQLRILSASNGIVQCVAFSPPDGRRLAICDDESAKVFDASNGTFLFALEGEAGTINRLAFSPDGQRILTGGSDGIARLWDASSGKQLSIFTGHTELIFGVAFSPDGGRIATCSRDQTAKVWDVNSGKELLPLLGHSAAVSAIAFSPDGQRILTVSEDHTARLWDPSTGKVVFILRGHDAEVTNLGFSPDGQRIVTGSYDQTVKVWDAATGVELLTLKGHHARIHAVAFSPNGQRILTASDDGTAKVWDAATPLQVTAWQSEEKLVAAQRAALARDQAAAGEQARALTARDPGAISKWLVLGPLLFEGYSGAKGLAEEQIHGEAQLRPSAGQHSQVASGDRAWRAVQLDDYRMFARQLFRWNAPHNVAYLACYIASETGQTNLLMKVGSQDQSKVYLNGKEIYLHDKPRKFVPDQDVVSGVQLKAGLNVVVFKVADEDGFWRGSLRFTDAAGQAVKGIRVGLTPP